MTPRSRKSHSVASYLWLKPLLDKAVEKPGLRFVAESNSRAQYIRSQANRYRNLLREIQQEQIGDIPGIRAQTAYDILIIRIQNEAGQTDQKNGNVLVFDHGASNLAGKVIDPETGGEISLEIPTTIFDV